jgi:hypothetical protein
MWSWASRARPTDGRRLAEELAEQGLADVRGRDLEPGRKSLTGRNDTFARESSFDYPSRCGGLPSAERRRRA